MLKTRWFSQGVCLVLLVSVVWIALVLDPPVRAAPAHTRPTQHPRNPIIKMWYHRDLRLTVVKQEECVAAPWEFRRRACFAGGLAGATPPAGLKGAGPFGRVWGAAPTNYT